MKKPRKITLVPANSIVQLGSAGTGRTFPIPVFGEKSMRVVDFPSTTKLIMHSPGEGKSHWEGFARQRVKRGATAAYNKRVKQQTSKPKPVVSNSYKNIAGGGNYVALVNGEPVVTSLASPSAGGTTRRARRIASSNQ